MGEAKKEIIEIPWQQLRLDFNFQKEDSHFSLQEKKDVFKIVFDVVNRNLVKCPKLKI